MKTIKHCQTFSWKFTLALLSFCIMQLISNGQSVQSRFWYTGDNIIDMSSYTTPVITPTNVSPSQFVSNGAYWTNGSLNETEFFVSDNTVFQDDGLGGLAQSQMYSILNTGPNTSIISSEVGVCPKPGSECNTYYIIYSRKDQTGNTGPATLSSVGLYYVEYNTDLANGGIVVPETQLCTDCFLAIGGQGNCFDFFPASFAISPRLANGERYMYAVMTSANSSCFNINTRLYKFRVTSNGFVQEDLTPGITSDFIEFPGKIHPTETELSPDRSYLAFARQQIGSTSQPQSGLDLVVVKLDPTTGNLLNSNITNVAYYDLPNEGLEIYSGLEFSSDSRNLFFNNRGYGIKSLSLATGLTSPPVNGSLDYSNSHLEMRNYASSSTDRRICAVKPPNQLSSNFEIGYINTVNNQMAQNLGLNNFSYTQSQTFQNVNGIYTLQDQVDGEDYATWSSPSNSVACCARLYEGRPTLTVSSNATWTSTQNPFGNVGEVFFEGDLVIAPGASLTINGMVLRFHPGAKLVISAASSTANGGSGGGKLYLNSTRLLGLACGGTWRGVRVLGYPNQPHLVSYQGYLNMTSTLTGENSIWSEIADAECGAATYNLENGNFLQSGGLIQTDKVLFRNNRQDVVMPDYPFTSSTSLGNTFFKGTDFIVNNDYRFDNDIRNRVDAYKIHRVQFWGCQFKINATSPALLAANDGVGLFLNDAFAIVREKPLSFGFRRTEFENLYFGIAAFRVTNNQVFTVVNSTFTRNAMAVLAEGVNNFSITNSIVNVTGFTTPLTSNTGIFANASTGFTIRDNTFTGNFVNNINSTPASFGCVIKNTCTATSCANNSVFRNNFNNLHYANQAEGRNRLGIDANSGFMYICNNNTNNGVDFRVISDPNLGLVIQGIRGNQFTGAGSTAKSPRNTFSTNTVVLNPQWDDFWLEQGNTVQNISYLHQNGIPFTQPINIPIIPAVPNMMSAGTTQNKDCANSNPFSLTIGDQLVGNGFEAVSYETAKTNYLNAKYLHQLLIDGGNPELIKDQIDYAWSDDAWTLRNQLLARSPNLSEKTLFHAADKNVLPPSLLLEVCLANVRSLKLNQTMERLKNYLPEYMVEIVRTYNEPQTYRKLLEEQYVDYRAQLDDLYQTYMRFMAGDSIDRTPVMTALLEDVPHAAAKLQLIDLHISKNNSTAATTALNDMQEYLDEVPNDEKEKANTFASFMISKANAVRNLDETDLSYLVAVASDSAHSNFVQAHSILRMYNMSDYHPVPLNPQLPSFKTAQGATTSSAVVLPGYVKLYPNPANIYLTVDYKLLIENGNVQVEVVDQTGKVVLANDATVSSNKGISNLVIADLPTGNYFVNIKHNNQQIASGCFVKGN